MKRSRLVLCVVLAMTLLTLWGLGATAGARFGGGGARQSLEQITGGGWMSPGPRELTPSWLRGQRGGEEKVHINIRLICDDTQGGKEHLKIHSNLFKFQATTPVPNLCDPEGSDGGSAEGSAAGICNGAPATLNDFRFYDRPSGDFYNPPPDLLRGDNDEVDFMLAGVGACNLEVHSNIQGSFQYHRAN